jgi:hypothetical protein
MQSHLPTIQQVAEALNELGHSQLVALSKDSGVPFTTLWNIRSGATTNPGLGTVGNFWPHLLAMVKERA